MQLTCAQSLTCPVVPQELFQKAASGVSSKHLWVWSKEQKIEKNVSSMKCYKNVKRVFLSLLSCHNTNSTNKNMHHLLLSIWDWTQRQKLTFSAVSGIFILIFTYIWWLFLTHPHIFNMDHWPWTHTHLTLLHFCLVYLVKTGILNQDTAYYSGIYASRTWNCKHSGRPYLIFSSAFMPFFTPSVFLETWHLI